MYGYLLRDLNTGLGPHKPEILLCTVVAQVRRLVSFNSEYGGSTKEDRWSSRSLEVTRAMGVLYIKVVTVL